MCECHKRCKVCCHFAIEAGEIYFAGIGEVVAVLYAGIKKDAVYGRVGLYCTSLVSTYRSGRLLGSECTYVSAKEGMASKSVISKTMLEALSSPCFATNASRRSLRRPTTETLTPKLTSREAIEAPIPDVAPTRSTCLYGKDILAMMYGCNMKVEEMVN
jgi:hypothetical protein